MSPLAYWWRYSLAALAVAVPWLAFGYLFAADEYVHAYNACALDALLTDPGSGLHRYFVVNAFPEPNLYGHAVLLALGRVMPLALAEKALVLALLALTGYAFSPRRPPRAPEPALAARNDLGAWARAGVAALALAFVFSASWQLGFVNYLTGMVAVLAALRATSPTQAPWWAVTAWSLLAYFCHPIALLFLMGTYGLRYWLAAGPPAWRTLAAATGHTALRFAPAFALLAAYLVQHSEVSTWRGASPWRLGGLLFFHHDLTLYAAAEEPLAKAVMALTAAVVAYGAYRLWTTAPLWARALGGVGAGVLLAAIVLAPDYLAGGALIHQRLFPMLFVWALWSVGALPVQWRASRFAARLSYAGVLLVLGALSVVRVQALRPVAEAFEELGAFAKTLPTDAVVLPVASGGGFVGSEGLSPKPVMHHFAATLGCERGLVLLDNYEAYVGYFPLHWNPANDGYAALTKSLERHPASFAPGALPWLLDREVYVLSYGPVREGLSPATYRAAQAYLQPVARSERGSFELYQLRR